MQKRPAIARQFLTVAGHRLDVTGLSARNRRTLVLGVRGADGDDPVELDLLLERSTVEQLAEQSAEDVEALRAGLVERLEELTTGDVTDDDLEHAEQIATALEAISTDATRRDTEATERATRAAAARERAGLEPVAGAEAAAEGDGDEDEAGDADTGDASGDETDADTEGEGADDDAATGDEGGDGESDEAGDGEAAVTPPLAASPTPRRVEARRKATAPVPRPAAVDERLVLRASANVPGVTGGQLLTTKDQKAKAFLRTIRATRGKHVGPRAEIPVMFLGGDDPADVYGEERTLRDGSALENTRKIDALFAEAGIATDGSVERKKLAASQGICAPSPVRYDQPVLGTDERRVRGGMVPMFGADRGGIKTLPPPHLADITTAVTVWTHANDIALNDPSEKACQVLTCPDEDESLLDAIVECLKIGNYRARNFPEQIEAWLKKTAQKAARIAENKMLTEIGDDSTQIAVQTVLGTTRDILTTLDRATAARRSFHRLDPEFPFHFGAPAWLLDNMITDLAREHPGAAAERLATSDAEIEAFIRARGINPTWFLDGETGQIFGAQADGALLGWPSHVIAYLYPEGQWIGGDGGTLDFGIVRDSTLNKTNDFIIMSEFFEFTHQIHLADSMRLDIDICPDGSTSAAKSISVCSTGS